MTISGGAKSNTLTGPFVEDISHILNYLRTSEKDTMIFYVSDLGVRVAVADSGVNILVDRASSRPANRRECCSKL